MTGFIDRTSIGLLSELAILTARSFVLAGIAAVGLSLFRPKATSLRLFIWTSVLYGSLALPLIQWLVPPLRIQLSELPLHQFSQSRVSGGGEAQSIGAPLGQVRTITRSEAGVSESGGHSLVTRERLSGSQAASGRFLLAPLRWSVAAAGIYLSVTALFLLRLFTGIVFSRRLARTAEEITGGSLMETLAFADSAGSCPVRVSNWVSVPVTVGVLRPVILLPADWGEWDRAKLRAVLAHERSHVARWDPLTQCFALLYRAFFWFSPLSWWLCQHLGSLAEQASDEAALAGGADQKQYAHALLDFFRTLQSTPRMIRWQGVSMARLGEAEQRLERILAWKGTVTMNLKKSLAVAILVLAIPVVYVVASTRPAHSSSAASLTNLSQQPTAPPAPPSPPVGGVSAVPRVASAPAIAPAAPIAPVAPSVAVAPEIAWSGQHYSGTSHGNSFSYHYGFDDDERFVIVSGKSDSLTMSGSTQDARHVEKLKKEIPGDFIWFQRDEKSYIIRDQATIDRARAFWAPQEELGKKQEELGKQQEALGKKQEELGKKMEEVRINVPNMTADLDRLKAKLQKLGPSATVEQIGELQSEIGELQSKMGEIQSQAGEEQGKLGEEQGKLGEQQGELAEKAGRQMKELFDEAIKNGTAKPEVETVKSPTL